MKNIINGYRYIIDLFLFLKDIINYRKKVLSNIDYLKEHKFNIDVLGRIYYYIDLNELVVYNPEIVNNLDNEINNYIALNAVLQKLNEYKISEILDKINLSRDSFSEFRFIKEKGGLGCMVIFFVKDRELYFSKFFGFVLYLIGLYYLINFLLKIFN